MLVEKLKKEGQIKFRPKGNSMQPKIKSGELVTINAVVSLDEVEVGDAVFCKVKGKIMLHLITAKKDGQVQISNNHGWVNGTIGIKNIFGKLVQVEP